MNLADTVRKYALLNAVKYDGTAQLNAVIGKVMTEISEHPKEIVPLIREIVESVNGLMLEEQQRELDRLGIRPEKKAPKKRGLPPLPAAERGAVVTRFPPEPNGYLHIGHAKAAYIDYEYARMYDGTFILRFDDTNPAAERREFYDIQKEDLRGLGIEWDREYRTSDDLPKHYDLARTLIENGHAYVCTCDEDAMRTNRRAGHACACRTDPSLGWNDFIGMNQGSAVVRLNADLQSVNTAMRDPVLFRIITHPHPVHKTRFRVWPTYDFTGAVEDSLSGVTHPFRSKEYELRDEAYFYVLECLGLRKPHLMEFSRLELYGMPVSKRKIKPLIDEGKVSGWDDPRLPTLRGLARRGITVEAVREFVLSQGISKAESVITVENLEAINRKILDVRARRYFFVPDPIPLEVDGAAEKTLLLKNHPAGTMGTRTVLAGSHFYIPADDAANMTVGTVFRLKDLYNVQVQKKTAAGLYGVYAGADVRSESEKVQWVTDEHVPLTVFVPKLPFTGGVFNEDSLVEVTGLAEPSVDASLDDTVVQFERFGFVRIEARDDAVVGIYAHP
jgi:glutamyl-tRNA synthetase